MENKELFERVKREIEQREQLRRELLEAATRDYLLDSEHNYSKSAKRYGLGRAQLRYYIKKHYGIDTDGQNEQKDTDNALQAIRIDSLQTP